MNSNLTTIIILVTVIHVAVLAVMIWIRVRRTEGDGIPVRSPKITPAPCAASQLPTGATTGSTRMSSATRIPARPGPPTSPTTGRCARPTETFSPALP